MGKMKTFCYIKILEENKHDYKILVNVKAGDRKNEPQKSLFRENLGNANISYYKSLVTLQNRAVLVRHDAQFNSHTKQTLNVW